MKLKDQTTYTTAIIKAENWTEKDITLTDNSAEIDLQYASVNLA